MEQAGKAADGCLQRFAGPHLSNKVGNDVVKAAAVSAGDAALALITSALAQDKVNVVELF